MRIFISYRRNSTNAEAGRLYSDLRAEFGQDSVFMDVVGIEPGRDFRKVIDEKVASCEVLLSIIGRDWLESPDDEGRRRLDNPLDYVRLETAAGLKRNIRVVPVLVQGAMMPRAEHLPEDMKELAYRHAVELTHDRWLSDLSMLSNSLRPKQQARGLLLKIASIILAGGTGVYTYIYHVEHKRGKITANSKALSSQPVAGAPGGADGESNNNRSAPRLVGSWPNGDTIKVGFLNGSRAQKYKTQQVAKEWSNFANLNFKFVDQGKEAVIRIRFLSPGIASWSFRGTEARDIPAQCPTMGLAGIGDNNFISPHDQRQILHEFGHVLGFLDEIQNPNAHIPWRPEVKARLTEYVYTEHVTDCRAPLNQPVTHREQLDNYRAFDPDSIMMAPVPSKFLTENRSLGGSSELSASDKAFAKNLYPK